MHLVPRLPNLPSGPILEKYPARRADVGSGGAVRRLLPGPRRTIGAWCFLDHFGPHRVPAGATGVPPHPHIGIQTVTWMLEGEMLHLDSLGNRQVIAPGQLNWMTAGRGIAHAEENLSFGSTIHGVQLWVALPDAHRRTAPAFDHYDRVPLVKLDGGRLRVLVGALCGEQADAPSYTPLVAAEIMALGPVVLPIEPAFEHGVAVLGGEARVEGVPLEPGAMLHLGRQRSELRLEVDKPARLLLLGGLPFEEPLLMWWNFVARTDHEIRYAIRWWERGTVQVPGASQAPLPALPLA